MLLFAISCMDIVVADDEFAVLTAVVDVSWILMLMS
jgi:hypothetical protein